MFCGLLVVLFITVFWFFGEINDSEVLFIFEGGSFIRSNVSMIGFV